jgi:hypothetical protein
MNRILFAVFFATVLLQGAELDVSGRWDSPTEMKNRDGQPVVLHMLLKQESGKISGGVWTEDHDEDQPKPIQRGSIDGDKLRFEVPQTAEAVVAFELELGSGALNGIAKFQGPNGQAQEIKLSFKRVPAKESRSEIR